MTDEPGPPEPPPLPPPEPTAVPAAPAAAAFTPGVFRALQRTQPWVRLLGIVGVVMSGLMLLIGLAAGAVGIATQQPQAMLMMVLYPLMAILYVVPSLYLLRYATRIREFVAQGLPEQLELALETQRALWKFIGTMAVVMLTIGLGLTVLGVLLGMLAGVGMQSL